MFRKLLLSTVAFVAVSGTAFAADLPSRSAPPVYIPPPPIFTWTGFYLGVNGGGAFGRTDEFDFTAAGTTAHHDVSGGFVGGTAGYDYQIGGIVVGVLGDADWASIRGNTPCPNPAFTCSSQVEFLGSARARLGFAVDHALIYATGGLGLGDFRYRTFTTATGADFISPDTAFKAGYAVGAGVEYAIDSHWSVKAEYLYYGFGTNTAPVGTLSAASPVDLRTNLQTFKLGIDYKFGAPPPAPVIAKY